jgi:hypothetical protein
VGKASTGKTVIVPAARARYLAEIADTVRGYHQQVDEQVKLIRQRQQLRAVKACWKRRASRRRSATAAGAGRNADRSARPQAGGYVAAGEGELQRR